ncbi:MAG: histidine phosphatase family protein [Cellvibrio sp.]|uniref:histidine phosphatase family protein n=1 Tax=Cellvibrio sp. TaxID=1965322 RepID=UPI0031A85857
MSDRKITLVRHGKVNGKAALYGHTDIELSEQGKLDLRNTMEHVHQDSAIDRILSSPLTRCAALATEFSLQHQIPLHIEPELMEMHFGKWDGIAFDELGDEWVNLENFWQTPHSAQPPGGESLNDFAQRVITAWELLLSNDGYQHQLVLCHGGVIRIIIAHILQLDWRNPALFRQLQIDYASHTRIDISSFPNALPLVRWIGAR